MKDFIANGRTYILTEGLRSRIKPNWQEMLNPAKSRVIKVDPYEFATSVFLAERNLAQFGESLVGKDILEIGCNEGARCFLMAKYRDTKVHGIDVDEYTVAQSPDLNLWNPKDIEFVHGKFADMRKELSNKFPHSVNCNVTFETVGIEDYKTSKPHDILISWDTLEHITNLNLAFNQMAGIVKEGGIVYHEYNPFFALNGGHSLCTLDFLYGHCRLSGEDFERYVREIRPEEEKIDLNFYHKCLNRGTIKDFRELAELNGFEVLYQGGATGFGNETELVIKRIRDEFLPEVNKHYPKASVEDLLYESAQIILRKK
jgi:2-polyprenyl-3-methyl-5-hydroxy-6-metoxy-1,4-benzoquinol methylase